MPVQSIYEYCTEHVLSVSQRVFTRFGCRGVAEQWEAKPGNPRLRDGAQSAHHAAAQAAQHMPMHGVDRRNNTIVELTHGEPTPRNTLHTATQAVLLTVLTKMHELLCRQHGWPQPTPIALSHMQQVCQPITAP